MQASEREQHIEFKLGEESYAIRISAIHEIIKMQHITKVPNCAPYMKGVMNLRGNVVPIISLRRLFQLPDAEATKATRIIFLNHLDETIGVEVDQVDRVSLFESIQPPPEHLSGIKGAFFAGVGMTSDGLIGIIRVEQLFVRDQESSYA